MRRSLPNVPQSSFYAQNHIVGGNVMLKNTSCIGTAGCCSDCMSWNVKPSCADCRVFWSPFKSQLSFPFSELNSSRRRVNLSPPLYLSPQMMLRAMKDINIAQLTSAVLYQTTFRHVLMQYACVVGTVPSVQVNSMCNINERSPRHDPSPNYSLIRAPLFFPFGAGLVSAGWSSH